MYVGGVVLLFLLWAMSDNDDDDELVDEKLSFKDHIQDKINKAFSMLGIIQRNFKHLDMHSFILLYKSMVRSQLDYCSSVWSPYKKGDIDAIEKVQTTIKLYLRRSVCRSPSQSVVQGMESLIADNSLTIKNYRTN